MNALQPTGGTLRDALQAAQRNTGRVHPDLCGDPLPPEVAHVWAWFGELQSARTSSGFAMNPLSFSEMLAWAMLMRRSPTAFEVQLLKDLDLIYLADTATRSKERDRTH